MSYMNYCSRIRLLVTGDLGNKHSRRLTGLLGDNADRIENRLVRWAAGIGRDNELNSEYVSLASVLEGSGYVLRGGQRGVWRAYN